MALRNGYGAGAGTPRIEVLPTDELPNRVHGPLQVESLLPRTARLHVNAPILIEVALSAAIGSGAAEIGHVTHTGFSFGGCVPARAHHAEQDGRERAHGHKGSAGLAVTNRIGRAASRRPNRQTGSWS
jgi:hypothetical protein